MDIHENWNEIKNLFKASFKSSFHYAIATVAEDGNPHVTPIGSLILGSPGKGIYFEKYPQHLPGNLGTNKQVCVLAVNSSKWFWLKSLVSGKFARPPAVRLQGITGELRDATDKEIELWQKRVSSVSFSKGHALMWRDMCMVRDIEFIHAEPIHLGEMTRNNWN